MLVLSRKQQEQVRIGDDITLTVVRIKGNIVRLGIDAPQDVRIIRAELPLLATEGAAEPASVGGNEPTEESNIECAEGADDPLPRTNRMHQLVAQVAATQTETASAL